MNTSLLLLFLLAVCDADPYLAASDWFPYENQTTVSSEGYAIFGTKDAGQFGRNVHNLGDINGDGLDDIIIGQPRYGKGRAVVLFGSEDGPSTTEDLAATGGFIINTTIDIGSGMFAYSVSGGGDYNDDGENDILISTYQNGAAIMYAVIIWGRSDNTYSDIEVSHSIHPDVGIVLNETESANTGFGYFIEDIGDFNGDSLSDFAITSVLSSLKGTQRGTVYILFGGTNFVSGDLDTTNSLQIYGGTDYEYFGYSMAPAGDFNNDSIADIVVGSYNYGTSTPDLGRVFVLLGKDTYTVGTKELTYFSASDTEGLYVVGDQEKTNLGIYVGGGCDINNDGFDDVLIGSPEIHTDTGNGYVAVLYGRESGLSTSINIVDMSSTQGYLVTQGLPSQYGQMGIDVGCLGLVDDDAYADYYIANMRYIDSTSVFGLTVLYGRSESTDITLAGESYSYEITNPRRAYNVGSFRGLDNTSIAMGDDQDRSNMGAVYVFENFPPVILTDSPTMSPTTSPTMYPSMPPSVSPTVSPTDSPTVSPTLSPTNSPTVSPTMSPTTSPTVNPTWSPTVSPTMSPTTSPTVSPTMSPTTSPTVSPTMSPTTSPTASPTTSPTTSPTAMPTTSPTPSPSAAPTTESEAFGATGASGSSVDVDVIVGAVFGGALGVAVIAGAAVYFYLLRKGRDNETMDTQEQRADRGTTRV